MYSNLRVNALPRKGGVSVLNWLKWSSNTVSALFSYWQNHFPHQHIIIVISLPTLLNLHNHYPQYLHCSWLISHTHTWICVSAMLTQHILNGSLVQWVWSRCQVVFANLGVFECRESSVLSSWTFTVLFLSKPRHYHCINFLVLWGSRVDFSPVESCYKDWIDTCISLNIATSINLPVLWGSRVDFSPVGRTIFLNRLLRWGSSWTSCAWRPWLWRRILLRGEGWYPKIRLKKSEKDRYFWSKNFTSSSFSFIFSPFWFISLPFWAVFKLILYINTSFSALGWKISR